jgi:hypothetical protein
MSATLDARSLRWQEGWFKVNDGSKSLATEGPYHCLIFLGSYLEIKNMVIEIQNGSLPHYFYK